MKERENFVAPWCGCFCSLHNLFLGGKHCQESKQSGREAGLGLEPGAQEQMERKRAGGGWDKGVRGVWEQTVDSPMCPVDALGRSLANAPHRAQS